MHHAQSRFELRVSEAVWNDASAARCRAPAAAPLVYLPVTNNRTGVGYEFLAHGLHTTAPPRERAGQTVLVAWGESPSIAGARAMAQVLSTGLAGAVFVSDIAGAPAMGLARCGDGFEGMRALHIVGRGLRAIDLRMGLAPAEDVAAARLDAVCIAVVGRAAEPAAHALRQLGARHVRPIESPDMRDVDGMLGAAAPDIVFCASCEIDLQMALRRWCARRLRLLAAPTDESLLSIRQAAWAVLDMLDPRAACAHVAAGAPHAMASA